MENQKIARIFSSISQYLIIQNVAFKPQAYQKAAAALEILPVDIQEIYKEKGVEGLEEISGVGKSLARKIEEYLKTGRVRYYDQLRKQLPVDLYQITQIEGIGPKTVKRLYQSLGVKSIADLIKSAREHKIRNLSGFGVLSEKNILREIAIFQKQHQRFLLGEMLPLAQKVKEKLQELKEVQKINLAGSIRRRKATIGDVDILVASNKPKKVMAAFTSLDSVVKVWGTGLTKSSVRLKAGFDIDLRVVKKNCWGAALQYFTGSKQHNIVLRKSAMKQGLKLNEYGVFKGARSLAGTTEEKFYRVLGMDWIPPEIRTNHGEIEASLKHQLPRLINYQDLRGDLRVCSRWGEGKASIEEMAQAAKKQGYHYLAITDRLKAENQDRLRKKIIRQMKAIDKANSRIKGIKILKGLEIAIRKNGELDFEDKILEKLDIVVISVQSFFQLPRPKMTQRILRAMDYPFVSLLAHPSNQIFYEREPSDLDWDKVFKKANQTHVLLEINSQPARLDLADEKIRQAKDKGVKMVVCSGAKHPRDLAWNEFGLAQARRGWAEKKDILNTKSWPEISLYLSNHEG